MSALVKVEESAIVDASAWTDERREFIRKHYCGNAPDAKVEAFLGIAQRRGLSPEEKHIYLVPRDNDWTIQTGIDGYRLIAARTRLYAGSDDPQFLFDPDEDPRKPILAKVTVWKLVEGIRCPFTSVAYWDEYCPQNPKQQFMWNKMPRTMLAKCAEALALRKAFPAELSGIYVDAEMDQAGSDNRRPTTVTPIRDRLAAQGITPQAEPPVIQVIDGELVETATGEIVEPADPDVAALHNAMKRLWASAKNKLDEDQMRIVLRSAYQVESHKDLTLSQLQELGDCYHDLDPRQATPFFDAVDVLLNDPAVSEKPLDAEQLKIVAEHIREQRFPRSVAAVVRLAYKNAENRLKGA